MSSGWYYAWAVLLTLGNVLALGSNLLGLPGNWIMVLLTALFAWLVQGAAGQGISWWPAFMVVAGLAITAECVEFAAGAAGAARHGASRRAMALAMITGLIGSFAGAAVVSLLIPIPLVGTMVGAVLGGALGTFAGAWGGEYWKGKARQDCTAVGTAAMIGRLLGMMAKVGLGAAMLVVATLAAFF